jgi:hypothetical protein
MAMAPIGSREGEQRKPASSMPSSVRNRTGFAEFDIEKTLHWANMAELDFTVPMRAAHDTLTCPPGPSGTT